jgi:hypothetical protein
MLACQMPPSLGSFAFGDVVGQEAYVCSLLVVTEEVEEASGSASRSFNCDAPTRVSNTTDRLWVAT